MMQSPPFACWSIVASALLPLASCSAVERRDANEVQRLQRELQRIENQLEVTDQISQEVNALPNDGAFPSYDFDVTTLPEDEAKAFNVLKSTNSTFGDLEVDDHRNRPKTTTRDLAKDAMKDVEKELLTRKAKISRDLAGQELAGAKWGVGIGFLTGGSREVQSASVSNGVVSVDKSRKSWPVALLETHIYPWQPNWDLMQFGVGPFAAIGLGEDNLLEGVGAGLMFGGRYISGTAGESGSTTSFNVGIGPYLVGEIQQLASGFSEGQAPPGSGMEVRYRTEEDWKLLVMFSFAWNI